jgi:hypothetical protein
MKISIVSDIHDNTIRLNEAILASQKENVESCICCGDIGQLETLQILAGGFKKVYLALGNSDFGLLSKTGLFPENVIWSEGLLEMKIDGKKIGVVHHDYKAKELAKNSKFDFVFYGHTHTPWEKMIDSTTILNPGEVAGHYGQASFAIFDTRTNKAKLLLLR